MNEAWETRPARPDEADIIAELIEEAVRWLHSKGTDQWANFVDCQGRLDAGLAGKLHQSIDDGECFVAVEGDAVAGSMVLDESADPEFWPDAHDVKALYVHRMVAASWAKGRGVGTALLRWAALEAARRGYDLLRLDAWARNQGLLDYYASQGFTQVAHHYLDHRGSGALFEKLTKAAT